MQNHLYQNVSKLKKDAKQLTVIVYFPLENVNKHDFFEILSPQSILLVSSFPYMKSGNIQYSPWCELSCGNSWGG